MDAEKEIELIPRHTSHRHRKRLSRRASFYEHQYILSDLIDNPALLHTINLKNADAASLFSLQHWDEQTCKDLLYACQLPLLLKDEAIEALGVTWVNAQQAHDFVRLKKLVHFTLNTAQTCLQWQAAGGQLDNRKRDKILLDYDAYVRQATPFSNSIYQIVIAGIKGGMVLTGCTVAGVSVGGGVGSFASYYYDLENGVAWGMVICAGCGIIPPLAIGAKAIAMLPYYSYSAEKALASHIRAQVSTPPASIFKRIAARFW